MIDKRFDVGKKNIKKVTNENLSTGNISQHLITEEIINEVEPHERNLGYGPNVGRRIYFFCTGMKSLAGLNLSGTAYKILMHLIEGMEADTAKIKSSPSILANTFGLSREHVSRIKSSFLKQKLIVNRDGEDYLNSRLAWKGKDLLKCYARRYQDPELK